MIKYFLSYRMNGIDELTLRLLTSKKKYNAYLETVEPDKSAEIRDYCKSVKTNRKRIITLFESYLDDPEKQTTNELDDAIEFCLKEFLKHFNIRDREAKSARNDYDETDESDEGSNSCFATKEHDESDEESCEATKETDETEEGEEGREKPDKTMIQNSFWGKTIMKGHFAKR